MTTPPFFAVQKQNANGELTLIAVDYTLDANDLDPTCNLRLYVDNLTIPANTFSLPGKNITILARKVNFQGNSLIDTSGQNYNAPVVPINPPKAAGGNGAGQSGSPGKNGGATSDTIGKTGQDGGSVTIYASDIIGKLNIRTDGGNGQTGQDGQGGGDGINGGPGQDAIIRRVQHDWNHPDGWSVTPATKGGNGGNGGKGGNAGKSGNGGNAGLIEIHLLTQSEGVQFITSSTGGKPGKPSKPGKGGAIGHAGPGGRIAIQESTGGHFNQVYWELSNERQGGAIDGVDLGNGSDFPTAPVAGKDSNRVIKMVSGKTSFFTPDTFTLNLLQLTLQYAEIAYLENNLASALSYYRWIVFVCSQKTKDQGLATELAGLRKQCAILQNQIGQGVDYFGNPVNYVPIVTLNYYQQLLDGMLASGSQIESVYNDYVNFLSNQKHNFNGMDTAINQANNAIDDYKKVRTDNYKKILTTGTVIDQLSDALVAQFGLLISADAAFHKAVEKIGEGCSFLNFLNLLKSILTVTSDVFETYTNPNIKTVSATIKDFSSLGNDISSGKIITGAIAAKGDVSSISKGWQAINPGSKDIGDSKKLIVEVNSFDRTIKPYLKLPEAEKYKKAIHDYVGIAQSRNAKLLEYTNYCIQYIALDGQITQKEQEVKRIKAQLSNENIPGLISYRNFLFGLYRDYKRLCLKYLYQENRAFIYWSQHMQPFSIPDNSFTGLEQMHNSIKGKIIDQINNYSQPQQPLQDIKIELNPSSREDQFTSLKNTGSITFQITEDEPKFLGWANILLTNFRVFLNGASVPSGGNFYIQIWHHGRAYTIDPQGNRTDYTHNQVLSIYEYTMNNGVPTTVAGGSMGGDGTGDNKNRIALSPFACFTINIPEKYNPGLDLSNMDNVEIHFSGYALPSVKFQKSK